MKKFLLLSIVLVTITMGHAQNVAVTDDPGYSANSSAMLDVYSINKGFLAPRMSTIQRNAIASPAQGLLVFDTSLGRYYVYNGTQWVDLSSGSASGPFWSYNSPYVYLTTGTNYLGLGTSTPQHKLHILQSVSNLTGTDGAYIDIQNSYNAYGTTSGIRLTNGTSGSPNVFKGGIFYQDRLTWNRGDLIFANKNTADATNVSTDDARLIIKNEGSVEVKGSAALAPGDAIFHVENANGDTVFAVYPEGVRINVDDNTAKAVGSRGGFAVGGFSAAKGLTNEYLRVTPDSVRVYIDDDFVQAKAVGSKGGFAVGGFSSAKGATDNYLFVQDDSSRIWTNGSGGFEIMDLASGNSNYLNLTPENYFIGHNSGGSNTSGLYNSFMGYNSGYSNTSGSNNTFLGYMSGYSNQDGPGNIAIGTNAGYKNISGGHNVFVGYEAGKENLASNNTFVGTGSGQENTTGGSNSFYGNSAGFGNTIGYGNSYFGTATSAYNYTGNRNTAFGTEAGYGGNGYFEVTGNDNLFIGYKSGYNVINNARNTCLGNMSGYSNQYGSGNVCIGFRAGYNETSSNKLYIANGATVDSTLIYGDFATKLIYTKAKLSVNSTTSPTSYIESVDERTYSDIPAVYGKHIVTDNYGIGLRGDGGYMGVYGRSINNATGVAYGLYGYASSTSSATTYGIYATSSSTSGTQYAGYFAGNVHVQGTLSKSAGTFRIDHPQDPENKYLVHSFVESPEMKNVYDGTVILDNTGKAIIDLPSYFSALNENFRYQLTPVGQYAPLFIEQEIDEDRFVIAGGAPGMKVSWQVTGIRKDPYAVQNPIVVEELKSPTETGKYLNPEAYGKSSDKAIHSNIKQGL